MSALTRLTVAAAADALAAGEASSEELTRAHLEAMAEARDLNCFIRETPELALERAREADRRRRAGAARGAMDGIPYAAKDLFCTKGVPSTAGSRILEGFTPSYESTVTQKLADAGAVMLGKANLDEFAMGSSNETSYYGAVKSPWQAGGADVVPGGSSGGSAAAVAARIAMCATGTDTGGSIRQPAAFCGVVGLKPTYGRCSRWGTVAFASSLDQAGPIARTVEDSAIMLQAMAGFDDKDSTSAPVDLPDFRAACSGEVEGLSVGIPSEYTVDGMPAEIADLWDRGRQWLEDRGAVTREISLPHTRYALPAYYIIAPAEASSNLARYDGVRYGHRAEGVESLDELYEKTRGEGFGAEVKRRVLIGTYVLSAGYYDAYYRKAQRVRTRIAEDFANAYAQVDVILTPTAPSAAFALGDKLDDPLAMYLNDVFTVPASLAGLPGISVPAGLDPQGLPLGLQLIGKPFDEATMLRAAAALEDAAGFAALPQRLAGAAA